jgi:hypothetical protein
MGKVRVSLGVVVAAGLALGVSAAYADTWSGVYGNTIVSTYDNGDVVHVYVEPDHSYTITDADGNQVASGTWKDGADGSCFTVTDPPPSDSAEPLCFEVKDYQVGDTFEGSDATGHFTATIVKGRD